MKIYSQTNKEVIKEIEQADEVQLNDYIHAILRRYNSLRTDREISVLSLPTDPKARDAELEEILDFMRRCYQKQDAEKPSP